MKKIEIRKIAVSAIIIAVAFVVTMLTASFKVQFLSLDLKDAVLSVIALLFGPYYGFISVIVRKSVLAANRKDNVGDHDDGYENQTKRIKPLHIKDQHLLIIS